MKLKHVLAGLLFTAIAITGCKSSKGTSPETKKEVLFTVDNKPYYTDEFIRVYNKNLDLVKDDSQKDLDNYLDLFIGYKLKVNKANKLGLQEGKKYQGELKTYRTQLSKNYLTDTKVTKALIDEAYQRSQKEISASHILFLVDENALPADTLKAYNKAIDVRKKALAGEDFGKLAAQYSEDPSAKENNGDLGYFSVFRMVYPFETGAYKTPKGQISMPVRTRYGYHIIKVNDVRNNRGDITVAHIMIMKPKKENAEEAAKAKSTINEIYQKLKQGEDFAALAKQFSQDKSNASNGGQLNRFSSGELSSTEFEDHAFALQKPGDISEPFQSQFGWHIVKLIEKHQVKTLEEVQPDFENRIRRDDRSKLITASLTEKLKKKYTVKKDNAGYEFAVKALTDSIYSGGWHLPANIEDYKAKTVLVINNDKKVDAKTFLDFVNNQQRANQTAKPLSRLASVLFDQFKDEQLNTYYNDNLEKEFPEFSVVMEEYRDGLLLFDLMEKEIWEKAKNDTIGLQKFYDMNKANYQWKARVDADVFSSTDEKMVKQAKDYLAKGKDAAFIKEKLNVDKKVNIIEKSGTFEQDSDALPKQAVWKTGLSDIIKEGNYYYVVKTNKLLPAGPKTLEEAKGRVINDYQQHLESNWVSELKKEFTIKVNQDTFDKVKKELNQK
ncbi:peptidylprolyl isomerase [Flavobacterium album]|uniref:Peptidylprolyl isomerase n=1 Tax=Flavobacterium album TaxID=2175091 RepID=A0A2S1QYD4_9FLAO|nr:peptidylprolyl isomerase [Flavobacterium album]AWH85261.1 peptidylprolyl isomerase [Flavobacterium album]